MNSFYCHELMTVERIHPKAPVMLIFIAIFTCLPSCINLSNIDPINTMISVTEEDVVRRNCLAKSCPYCVRNSLLEDQNRSIVEILQLH